MDKVGYAVGRLIPRSALNKAIHKQTATADNRKKKRRRGMVKKAWETQDWDHDTKTGKIYTKFYGSRPEVMSGARAQGLKIEKEQFGKHPDEHNWVARGELSGDDLAEAKADLRKKYTKSMERNKGLFGGAPVLSNWKRRSYKRAKEGLSNLDKLDEPSAQAMHKQAYKLQGQTEVQGIPIAIENKKGSVRRGTDRDGHKWETKMKAPYGYIKGTKGVDGEEVDAFVGPNKKAPNAFVVHQNKPDGKGYDEDKVILGTNSKAEAKKLFLQHYDDPKFLGPVAKVSMERLKELTESKGRLVKISRASYAAMLNELAKNAAAQDAPAKPKPSTLDLVRKAGPAIGGTVGTAIGTLAGMRRGGLVRGALTGLGTGATLGWTPDMAMSAREGWKKYRSVG